MRRPASLLTASATFVVHGSCCGGIPRLRPAVEHAKAKASVIEANNSKNSAPRSSELRSTHLPTTTSSPRTSMASRRTCRRSGTVAAAARERRCVCFRGGCARHAERSVPRRTLAAGAAVTAGSTGATPGAGRLSKRLNAVISPIANSTAASAVTRMTNPRLVLAGCGAPGDSME